MLASALPLLSAVLTYSLLLLTLLWCWFQWTHRDLLKLARKMPVIYRSWPLVGHLPYYFGSRDQIAKTAIGMALSGIGNGLKSYICWFGPLPLIHLAGMDDIQTVLNSSNSSDKAAEYALIDSGQGPFRSSLLTSPGHVWKITRKHFNPLFHPRNVQHMMPVFNQNSRALMSCLSKHVGTGPVNVMTYTMDISLKTICNLLFGPDVDIDISTPEFHGLMTVVEMVPQMFIQRIIFPWLRIEPIFRFVYRDELKKMNFFWNNFTDKRMEKAKEISKRKKMKLGKLDGVDNDSAEVKLEDRMNIIDAFEALQENHPQFTDEELRDEMLTFYCTGTDTVGSSVASCFLVLAYYQDIQERLYQEISSTVGPDDDVTQEDLNRMPYLDQVVKETLRWFLTVPFVMRKANKDIVLSEFTVPAGNTLCLALAAIHMDPKLYPDPHKFDPERFSPENSAGKERFAFVPFSGGPRNCIAKTYATLLMKIMVVHVLRKFRLSTKMDIFNLKKRLIVTLINCDGYNISLEHRS